MPVTNFHFVWGFLGASLTWGGTSPLPRCFIYSSTCRLWQRDVKTVFKKKTNPLIVYPPFQSETVIYTRPTHVSNPTDISNIESQLMQFFLQMYETACFRHVCGCERMCTHYTNKSFRGANLNIYILLYKHQVALYIFRSRFVINGKYTGKHYNYIYRYKCSISYMVLYITVI